MKQKQMIPQPGVPPQVSKREQRRANRSTASILARGVRLAQVLRMVQGLRPLIQQTG